MRGKIYGRKRHIRVDTQGLLLASKVHSANIADRTGAKLLLGSLPRSLPRLSHLFANKGYTGPLREWIAKHLQWSLVIVPHAHNESHQQEELVNSELVLVHKLKKGFQVQRKRWVAKRIFAWLTKFRRLARDYEELTTGSEPFFRSPQSGPYFCGYLLSDTHFCS